jgi:hypothetical protein
MPGGSARFALRREREADAARDGGDAALVAAAVLATPRALLAPFDALFATTSAAGAGLGAGRADGSGVRVGAGIGRGAFPRLAETNRTNRADNKPRAARSSADAASPSDASFAFVQLRPGARPACAEMAPHSTDPIRAEIERRTVGAE